MMGAPQRWRGGISAGPPARTGRLRNWPKLIILSYMVMAPAIPTLIEKRVGILTTWAHRASTAGESETRSAPKTYAARRG